MGKTVDGKSHAKGGRRPRRPARNPPTRRRPERARGLAGPHRYIREAHRAGPGVGIPRDSGCGTTDKEKIMSDEVSSSIATRFPKGEANGLTPHLPDIADFPKQIRAA